MSVYNGEKYLPEAIESILNQTLTDFEFIIIDDGSEDRSKQLIEKYVLNDDRIILMSQNNKGLPAALNAGIQKARASHIARMDADDISFPERLELQYYYLVKNINCVAVGSNAEVIDQNGRYIYTTKLKTSWESIKRDLPTTPFFHSSTMFSKTIAEKCNLYDVEMLTAQDAVLFSSMAVYGELHNIERSLIRYRLSPESISLRSKKDIDIMKNIIYFRVEKGLLDEKSKGNMEKIYRKKIKIRYKKAAYYMQLGKHYIEHRFSRSQAMINLSKAILYDPSNIRGWYNISLLILPYKIIAKIKML